MKQEEEKQWEQFVLKVMIPSKCGHLRFKVKHLLEDLLKEQREEMIREILGKIRGLERERAITDAGILIGFKKWLRNKLKNL